MKYAYPLHILYTPTPTHLCIFSVKKSVIINCCFMAPSAICGGHLSIKSVQLSLINPDINNLDVSPSEDIFEWDSIIKWYIKIHYLDAFGTKLFLITMPHCTYFVRNFKTFRRYFLYVWLLFFTRWLKVTNYFWVNEYKCLYLLLIFEECLALPCCHKLNLNKTFEAYIFLLLYIFFYHLMIILSWCKL